MSITSYRELETFYYVFKRSDFNDGSFWDRVRKLRMRIWNWITRRGKKGKFDHGELIINNKRCVSTASSEGGFGVRKISFARWCKRLGNPHLVILAPPFEVSAPMTERLIKEIEEDCGREYNSAGALANWIKQDRGLKEFSDDSYEYFDPLYCTQAGHKWIRSILKKFKMETRSLRLAQRNSRYTLPDELYNLMISDSWEIVYEGDAYDLLKPNEK